MMNGHPRTLRSDSTGAIMVVGLVMGSLLVGALYHIVSVGDAILWRENLQDAADAAAYESAVWTARGLNVVVFLNIVMSGAMAILVALRGAIIFLSALHAALLAATLGCFFPVTPITVFLCGISTQAGTVSSMLTTVRNLETSWKQPLRTFMEGVQVAQKAVATAMPMLAVTQSAVRTSDAYDVSWAVGLNTSLVPSTTSGPLARLGIGVSLPVELDGAATLCERAGEFVPHELFALVERAGLDMAWLDRAGGWLRQLAGSIAGSMPQVFCGEASIQDIRELADTFRQIASENCAGARQSGRVSDDSDHTAEQREKLQDYGDYWQEGFIAGPDGTERGWVFDTARCEEEQLQRVSDEYEPDTGVKPAKLWGWAGNGNFFLQSWGLAKQEPPHLDGNDRGIGFPAPYAARMDAQAYDLGTAQAETYWDSGEGAGCDGSASNCRPNFMWLMRWKARLRRLHNPAEMLVRAGASIAVTELVDQVQGAMGALSTRAGDRFANWARGGQWEQVSNFLRGNLWDAVYRNTREHLGFNPVSWGANETVGEWLAREAPPPDQILIH
jgi:hypothetical protein